MRSLLVCLALLYTQVFAAEPLRILCIGDSITQGGRAGTIEYTYRLPLQRLLREKGIAADFVGTRRNGLDMPASWWPQPFDPDHQGYYGATTAQVRSYVQHNLPAIQAPHIALIHLGTNDLQTWEAQHSVIKPLEEIISGLRTKNPRVVVLIGLPTSNALRARWLRWKLNRLEERLHTEQSPVVAINFGEWNRDDTQDGIHPNEQGQRKMAAAWFKAIISLPP